MVSRSSPVTSVIPCDCCTTGTLQRPNRICFTIDRRHHKAVYPIRTMKSLTLVKLALCGPSDVEKEVGYAQKVIDDWNQLNSDARGVAIKHFHWSTDTYPDAKQSGQNAVNRQMIDDAEVIVAIFWSKLGTPTAVAESGTVEEIRRGIARGRKVLVYFSDLEPLPPNADESQVDRLWRFRQDLRATSSCWSFQSRSQFREVFANHLTLLMNEFKSAAKDQAPRRTSKISQKIKGNNNIQVSGDGNQIHQYPSPPILKTIVERPRASISPAQEFQISEWIKELAEGTVGKPRGDAFRDWGGFFLRHFKIPKRGLLPASEMQAAEEWFRKQRAIQKRGYKAKAPDEWRSSRITAIKSAMNKMGKDKTVYYPELSRRLKIQPAFTSITKLTKTDLGRVYDMVLGDARAS